MQVEEEYFGFTDSVKRSKTLKPVCAILARTDLLLSLAALQPDRFCIFNPMDFPPRSYSPI